MTRALTCVIALLFTASCRSKQHEQELHFYLLLMKGGGVEARETADLTKIIELGPSQPLSNYARSIAPGIRDECDAILLKMVADGSIKASGKYSRAHVSRIVKIAPSDERAAAMVNRGFLAVTHKAWRICLTPHDRT